MRSPVAPALALLLLGLGTLAIHAARRGDHRRHGACMAANLALLAAFLPFHLPTGWWRIAAWTADAMLLHRAAGLAGVAFALLAAPLGLAALAYRSGGTQNPRWPRRHRALAIPAAASLTLAALAGLLHWILRA
jgi:hypothetical protein